MELPPDVILSAELQRGHVWHLKDFPFENGTVKNKFFVVVSSSTTADNPTYVFLTTSQTDKIRQNKLWLANSVTVHAGVVPFFFKETMINCRAVQAFDRKSLAEWLSNGRLAHCGKLPDPIIERLDSVIKSSILLSDDEKRQILPAL